jgi:hypothetical protein
MLRKAKNSIDMPPDDIAISVRNLTKTNRIFRQPGERFKQAMTFGLGQYHKEFTTLKDVSFVIWVKPLASSAVDYSTYVGWLESVTLAEAWVQCGGVSNSTAGPRSTRPHKDHFRQLGDVNGHIFAVIGQSQRSGFDAEANPYGLPIARRSAETKP